MVSDAHIAFLVDAGLLINPRSHGSTFAYYQGATRHELDRCDRGKSASRLGGILMAANAASVEARYGVKDRPIFLPYYHKSNPTRRIDPVQVLKSIDCFAYQACEDEGWEASQAHAFCEALRRAAIHALPGYDKAAWGAPEDPRDDVKEF